MADQPPGDTASEPPSPPTAVRLVPREFVAYQVTDSELDQLMGTHTSQAQTFFGITAGSAVTAGMALVSALLAGPPDPIRLAVVLAIFVGVLVPCGLLAIYFWHRMGVQNRAAEELVRRIKTGRGTWRPS